MEMEMVYRSTMKCKLHTFLVAPPSFFWVLTKKMDDNDDE